MPKRKKLKKHKRHLILNWNWWIHIIHQSKTLQKVLLRKVVSLIWLMWMQPKPIIRRLVKNWTSIWIILIHLKTVYQSIMMIWQGYIPKIHKNLRICRKRNRLLWMMLNQKSKLPIRILKIIHRLQPKPNSNIFLTYQKRWLKLLKVWMNFFQVHLMQPKVSLICKWKKHRQNLMK